MKRKCAKAALNYIEDGMTVGLGGGSTVGFLATFLKESGKQVKVVTPSDDTMALCKELGLLVIPITMADEIDIAFDGCDELDIELHALKTNGAIHMNEKIIASMAKDYVPMVDQSKVYDKLPLKQPVAVEIIPESAPLVMKDVRAIGGDPVLRKGSGKAGYVITEHGNYIMDVTFAPGTDAVKAHNELKMMTGVVETAIFVTEATFALCIDGNQVNVIK